MKVIDIIEKTRQEGRCRFTFELLPPLKGEGTESVFSAIDTLAPLDPAYINVTFHREEVRYEERADGLLTRHIARRRPGTVGISAAITKRYGLEVVPHLICGGHSTHDIEDALIDMDFLGMRNVLALRGDNLNGERRFAAHPQGHGYASQLVEQIAGMNHGLLLDSESRAEGHRTDFCIGVAGYPEKHAEAPNMTADIENLKRKVDAGADYIVTQMGFDNARIFSFIDACRAAGITVPIIPGIKPISTKGQLTLLPHVFHVDLPEDLVRSVTACRDNDAVRTVGVEWAAMQAAELKKAGLPVIHFYTMGRPDNVAQIIKRVF